MVNEDDDDRKTLIAAWAAAWEGVSPIRQRVKQEIRDDGSTVLTFDPPLRVQEGEPIELRPRFLRWLPDRTELVLERLDGWGHTRLPQLVHALFWWPACDGLDLLYGCPIRVLVRARLRMISEAVRRSHPSHPSWPTGRFRG